MTGEREELASTTDAEPVVDIVICPDERYLAGAEAMIHSAAERLASDSCLRIHILADYLTSESLDGLATQASRFGDVSAYRSRDRLEVSTLHKWFDSPALGRLWVDLLPDTIDRVIYIDCDTIIREDLTRLARESLNGYAIGAVYNLVSPDRAIQVGESVFRPDFGSPSPGHFNSGILLLDMKVWRSRNCGARARDLWRQYGDQFEAPDQDLLNYMFAGSWQPLCPIWNKSIEVSIGQNIEGEWLAGDHGILHYTGPVKPWHAEFPSGELKDLFEYHLAASRRGLGNVQEDQVADGK